MVRRSQCSDLIHIKSKNAPALQLCLEKWRPFPAEICGSVSDLVTRIWIWKQIQAQREHTVWRRHPRHQTGETTKPSEAEVSKGKKSWSHYSLMSFSPQLSLLLITLNLLPFFSCPSLTPRFYFGSIFFEILVINSIATMKIFCWQELVKLRGPGKAKQNGFYLRQIHGASQM